MGAIVEKEIKILEIDVQKLQERLEFLWAEKHFEGHIHDIYFDTDSDELQGNNRIFRIRKKGEDHIYTIKKKTPSPEFKVADEFEMPVTNAESFAKVLESYGMKKTREKHKFRISYSLDNAEFDIDIYDWIPPLLEIEANSNAEIHKFILLLWLKNHKRKKFGSRWLYKHYKKEYSYF